MTNEAKGVTDKWVADKGAKYAYAYDAGGKLMRACGVRGIPHSVVVDPTGKVVYSGSPGGLSEEMVRGFLGGALKKPLWELPKSFSKVRAAVVKGDYAAAIREGEALAQQKDPPAEAAAIVDSLKSMVTGAVKGAGEMEAAGDVLGAKREYDRILKSAKGLPEEEACRARLAAIAGDAAVQKSLKAQLELEKIEELPGKSKKDAEARKVALEAFSKKHPDDFAGKRARELLNPKGE